MKYCESPFLFHRRKTREVVVGNPARGGVIIGGEHPVVVQSMITCDTMDTAASVQQDRRVTRHREPPVPAYDNVKQRNAVGRQTHVRGQFSR